MARVPLVVLAEGGYPAAEAVGLDPTALRDPYCTGNAFLFAVDALCESSDVGALRVAPAPLCERRHGNYPDWAIPTAMADAAHAIGAT